MIKRKIAFDTNIYISIFNKVEEESSFWNTITESLHLVAVVLLELEIGIWTKEARQVWEIHKEKMGRINRILTPSKKAYSKAGMILNILHQKESFTQPGLYKITNDVLIAATCVENGVTLKTKNRKDFSRLSLYLKGLRVEYF